MRSRAGAVRVFLESLRELLDRFIRLFPPDRLLDLVALLAWLSLLSFEL
jgi:hypothetical protein